MVPETQDMESLRLKPGIPSLIGRAFIVLPAIAFDDQSRSEVHEIHDIGPDGLLTAKLLTHVTMGAQVFPQKPFGIGHVLAQCLGENSLMHGHLP